MKTRKDKRANNAYDLPKTQAGQSHARFEKHKTIQ